MSSINVRFHPNAEGLIKVLGPLETEIMQNLWENSKGTVRSVHRVLSERRSLAYTTVLTCMQRLTKKGLLIQTPSETGPAYIYTPAISMPDFHKLVVQQVLTSLLEDYGELVITYIVEYLGRHDPSGLSRLHELLHQQEEPKYATTQD
ncbi:MAG: BlaI/MecI/CopY family transcriptional regulator [Chloroflexi bacterium AL-N10]|nr:BlaI/MecI/CopY family transcriptional regulator [Chloroflexi bacterium AL-N1]NOK71083.1 BlaI/MecI/CopY family transcriptional regulator [Chloroflexi bacterium AL-N10]NOK77330.1 BlaI/MecI/CopY family transcriptional regulator [Chloroflexi bacterium AL-N5]